LVDGFVTLSGFIAPTLYTTRLFLQAGDPVPALCALLVTRPGSALHPGPNYTLHKQYLLNQMPYLLYLSTGQR